MDNPQIIGTLQLFEQGEVFVDCRLSGEPIAILTLPEPNIIVHRDVPECDITIPHNVGLCGLWKTKGWDS